MSSKKNHERAELHKTIWQIANDLRGSVDGWDFKQYVLGMLFYRFISENLVTYINKNQHESGDSSFSYELLTDAEAENAREQVVEEKGFFILPSELFSNVVKRADSDDNLNVTLEKIFKDIESSANGTESEGNLKGLFDDIDVNSNKLGGTVIERNSKLRKLIKAIGNLNFGKYKENTIDAFGDAYEYLMTMYAANAGKSGGEFFTPQEVSELLTRLSLIDFGATKEENGVIIVPDKKSIDNIYDPACGSGSLLLNFVKILGKDNVAKGFFGQEINLTTYNLARINMFLHDVNFEKFNIAYGDTLVNPLHWDEQPFEAIVSNPPYSKSWEGDNNPIRINDSRYAPAGVLAPKGKSDYAFIMHILHWLSSSGVATIVEYPGALKRPGSELQIRKYLIENNYVDAVINLPANLFFGTPIETAILVIRKNKVDTNIKFIDARQEFIKVGTKNKLNKENIERIVSLVKYGIEDEMLYTFSYEKIKEYNYSLLLDTYQDNSSRVEINNIQDINSQLNFSTSRITELQEEMELIIKNYEEKYQHQQNSKTQDILSNFFTYYRGKRLKKSDRIEGNLPLVTAGFQNEGIAEYISNSVQIFENAITIDMFGNCFWRPYKFACDDNIIVLKHIYLNNKTAYYFLEEIKKNLNGFNYNKQYRLGDLKRHSLSYASKDGVIDFETIEELSRLLERIYLLETDLASEFESQLSLRKKQITFYRQSIMNY